MIAGVRADDVLSGLTRPARQALTGMS